MESRLTYIKLARRVNGHAFAWYRCACGVEKILSVNNVERGLTKSCGCYRKEVATAKATIHGFAPTNGKHPLYSVWYTMKARCYNPNHNRYHVYGGVGVTVCDEWRISFAAFYEWCITNGWKKGMQIDKDLKGGKEYSPQTCTLVSSTVNNNNRSNNVYVEYMGQNKSVSDWARELGLDNKVLQERIRNRWPPERAFKSWKKIKRREEA
jgi:hypothetical protein